MNPLRFARLVAGLRDQLEASAWHSRDGAPATASYLRLLDRLAQIERPGRQVIAAVTEAVAVFYAASARAEQARQAARERQEAEYAEAVARHEVAAGAERPYCGAAPGAVCRTAGRGNPLGIHDHSGRYRAARRQLGGAPGGCDGGQGAR